ncbi:1-acyl-sn-glycerol-3-phosphate acyltransferase [Actinomyces sp. B33]|uniref:1-acyl-sn-glycerol-3-phosphate acyltransferase n=1 Tax=Actinomyces sp. B33 TaxID=2942131 RepID=UPI00234068BC|nr:1-acyl-sn-glycerol-3-phosphate acyltransferase [Actinomyces sp. B33]MDC4232613.1 1-acyl-sn-glycerol-3-phosphate acyltransferase [Actinomyces sp. B33]
MGFKRAIASLYLAVSRWTLVAEPLPDKVIIVGAPHTSNWDGVFMAVSLWRAGRDFQFLVKDSLAHAPVLGWFIRAIGGVAVERTHPHGMVGEISDRIRSADSYALAITPKGTRSPRPYWKSGFYRIAVETGTPIQFGFIDSRTRTFGWGGSYRLTGDVRADMEVIRAFYADKEGIRPELASTPRLRAEEE